MQSERETISPAERTKKNYLPLGERKLAPERMGKPATPLRPWSSAVTRGQNLLVGTSGADVALRIP